MDTLFSQQQHQTYLLMPGRVKGLKELVVL